MANVPDHVPMGQHPDGQQLDDVRHMCPDCGIPVKPFCPTCLGVGSVTGDRLALWQTRALRESGTP